MNVLQKNVSTFLFTLAMSLLIGFVSGIYYQQQRSPQPPKLQYGENRMMLRETGGGQGRMMGKAFRPVSGEIIESSESSLTIKLPDGSTKILLISESTVITKSQQATTADLKINEKVTAFGDEDPSGTITVKNIQLGDAIQVQEKGKSQN